MPTHETTPVWARTVPVAPPLSDNGTQGAADAAAEPDPLPALPMQKDSDPEWANTESQAESTAGTDPKQAVHMQKPAPKWAQTVPAPPGEELGETELPATASKRTWPPAGGPQNQPERVPAAPHDQEDVAPAQGAIPEETDIWPPDPPTEHSMPAWPPSSTISNNLPEPSTIPAGESISSWPASSDSVPEVTKPPAAPATTALPAVTTPPTAPVIPAPAAASRGPMVPPAAIVPPAPVAAPAQTAPPAAPVPTAPTVPPAEVAPTAPTVPPAAALPTAAPVPPAAPTPPAPTAAPAPRRSTLGGASKSVPWGRGQSREPAPDPAIEWPAPVAIPSWAPQIQITTQHPTPVVEPPQPVSQPASAPPAAVQPQPAPMAAAPAPVARAPVAPQPAVQQRAATANKSSWEVVEQKQKSEPQRVVPTPEDRSYAEWFAWAKRGGAPASACHAAAQGAFQALSSGKDVATAVQWATAAMTRPPVPVSADRQSYCAWFSLANIDLALDQHKAHAFAPAAVHALDAGANASSAHAAGLHAAGIK